MTSNLAYRVLSVNVGLPATVERQGKTYVTAIDKRPAQGTVRLAKLNFAGDGQADRKHHGGPDKAVCVYSYAHYAHWAKVLGRGLPFGAFGENVTIDRLREDDVCIGDIFWLGTALVQISQPRQPCFKLGAKHGRPDLPLLVQTTGHTGFYLRALEEGVVAAGDMLTLVRPDPARVTVAFANDVMYRRKRDVSGIRRVLAVDALSAAWKEMLGMRLVQGEADGG